MSTTIQQNNINLQSVLDTVNALEPNNGGGVDTCTVEISAGTQNQINPIYYTCIENNEIVTKQINNNAGQQVVLTNVVCGSAIYFSLSANINFIGTVENIEILFYSGVHMAFLSPKTPVLGKLSVGGTSGGGSE